MAKNWIIGIVIVAVIVLGAWFYIKGPAAQAPSNAGDQTQTTGTQTGDNTTGDNMSNSTSTGGINVGVDTGVTVGATTGTTKSFTITGSNFKFVPNQITVKKGDTVKVTFKVSDGAHDFWIDGYDGVHTNVLHSTDAPQTITFVADKAGQFEFYCHVGTHRQMGMVGKFIVTS